MILVAGAAMASLLLPDLRSLRTPYGLLLISKIAGFAILMGLASANRWRLVPGKEMIRHKSLIILLSLLAIPAFAQQPDNGGARMGQQMQQMQAQMQAMQALMARIQQTQDPAQRQRLMQEHMQSMQHGMMMMGQMMQGGMHQGPAAQQCQNADTQCQMNQMQMNQRMMGQQMGMMQQMMMQMMEQMMATGKPSAEESP